MRFSARTGSGFEFTNPDGTPLHPAAVTDTFELTAYLVGLPPIRMHDLRHGAARSGAARTAEGVAPAPGARRSGTRPSRSRPGECWPRCARTRPGNTDRVHPGRISADAGLGWARLADW